MEPHLLGCHTRSGLLAHDRSWRQLSPGLLWLACLGPLHTSCERALTQAQCWGLLLKGSSVIPLHSAEAEGWLKGELAIRRGPFCPMQRVPKHSQQLGQSSGVLWMSLSLPSSLSKAVCVVLPVRCPLGSQSQPVCPGSCSRRAGAAVPIPAAPPVAACPSPRLYFTPEAVVCQC